MEVSPEQQQALEQQKGNCPFCKIIKGDIPSKKVYDDDKIIAILDINPAKEGHTLVMPKEHYPIMPLIPPETFDYLFKHVQKISKALKNAMLVPATTIFIANGAAAGQQSQHFMLHIIPREDGDGLTNFELPIHEVDQKQLDEAYSMLSNNMPILISNHLKRWPTKGIELSAAPSGPKKLSKEQVLQIVEQNPQLKEFIIKQPKVVKQQIATNGQLKMLFANVSVDEIRKELTGKEPKYEDLDKNAKESDLKSDNTNEEEDELTKDVDDEIEDEEKEQDDDEDELTKDVDDEIEDEEKEQDDEEDELTKDVDDEIEDEEKEQDDEEVDIIPPTRKTNTKDLADLFDEFDDNQNEEDESGDQKDDDSEDDKKNDDDNQKNKEDSEDDDDSEEDDEPENDDSKGSNKVNLDEIASLFG